MKSQHIGWSFGTRNSLESYGNFTISHESIHSYKKRENFLRSKEGLNSDGVVKFGLVYILKKPYSLYPYEPKVIFFSKKN
jgi:hypothetical protein